MARTHPIRIDTVVTMRRDVRIPARRRDELDGSHWIVEASAASHDDSRATVRMATVRGVVR